MTRCGLAIALLCALSLTSCIEGDETIWLQRDGSGRFEAVYKMPSLVADRFGGAEELTDRLIEAAAGDQHVDLTSISHRKEGLSVICEFSGTFDSLQQFTTFPQRRLRDPEAPDEPVEAEALFGESKLVINDLSIQLARRIDFASVLPDRIKDAPALLGESAFHYTVHLPVEAAQTDADSISDDGKTLRWNFLLREHVNKPISLFVKAPLPIPWWVWCAGILLVVAFLAILFLAIRRVALLKR